MHRRFLLSGLAGVATVALAACGGQTVDEAPLDGPPTSANDIVQIASSIDQFSTFMILVEAAELEPALKGDGPFTVFMPSEAAFAKVEPNVLTELLLPENKEKLVALISYHVLPRAITSEELRARAGALPTVEGSTVRIDGIVSPMKVDSASITQADITARNGVIHRIDELLVPRPATPPAAAVVPGTGANAISNETIDA